MPRGHRFYVVLGVALMLPLRSSTAAVDTAVPVIQLTAQPSRYLNQPNFFGSILLRELQRQAVLIAARDELGLGTRDMVLREPFVVHGTNGAVTVLMDSKIFRSAEAQILLARLDGNQPVDPNALADLPVDAPAHANVKWVGFKMPRAALPDYADFCTQCEEASRGSYLQALLDQNVLGNYPAHPVRWVTAGDAGAIDPKISRWLEQFDVFSQFIAVRLLHQQIRSDGALPDRLSSLVQAYANLSALTHDHWSQTNKVFLARSLLYAQRLVVHENASSASLYARAYARAFTGLHAAALADLDAADATRTAAPAWAKLIRARCNYNLDSLEDSIAGGPWRYRQLAIFLAAKVARDEFPQDRLADATDRAIENYPGMFLPAPSSPDTGDGQNPSPLDQVINQTPVVIGETLKPAELPSSAHYAVRHLALGEESFKSIALLRDRLKAAGTRPPLMSGEPSMGVLADLVEQQEMLAIVHRAISLKAGAGGSVELHALQSSALPISREHPWGAYVEAMDLNSAGDNQNLLKILAKLKDRDPGPWVNDALSKLDGLSIVEKDPMYAPARAGAADR